MEGLLSIYKADERYSLGRFFEAGGRETFNWLKNNSIPKQGVYDKRVLEWRLGHFQVGDDFYSNIPESQLRQWEGLLSGNPMFQDTISARDHSGLIYAIRYFTSKKPALVAKFLHAFTNPVVEQPANSNRRTTRIITQSGYFFASYFGHICPENRVKHLTDLTDAKDPFVQAAAAIYLSFEQPDMATTIMQQKAQLEGTPGAWAALALVRRGDSEYMTKALTLFDSYPPEHIEVLPHGGSQSKPLGHRLFYQRPRHALEYCLKEHLFFLSSKYNLAPPIDHPNYASKSKPIWNENRKMNHEEILKWWHRNKTIFTDTRDPLIDQLIAQKID